jgi:4,5-dihydroxyphthalate decarboxylase
MAALRLRAVSRTQGNNQALKTGAVTPEGYELAFEEVSPLVHEFRRMVRESAYDVCEMAFTTYLAAKAAGKPFTALPVFLVRGLHHGAIVCPAGSALRGPAELEGSRVGVNRGYTVTTGVWARAILAAEHGLDLERVTWVRSGDEHVAEWRPPANVVQLEAGGDLGDAVAAGDLAAAVGITANRADLRPALPAAGDAGIAALRDRGFYPINHLVVVRDDLLTEHPDLAPALFDAFAAAKNRYVDRLAAGAIDDPTPTDQLYRQVMDVTGSSPLPYGIAPNRTMIDALIGHAVAQHVLDQPPAIEDLFAAGTHELAG